MRKALLIPLLVCAAAAFLIAPAQAAAKKQTVILCANKAGAKYKEKVAPSQCVRFGTGGSFAGGVFLTNLVWQGFGTTIAPSFTGIECGFHLPCANIPVQGVALNPVKRCGHIAYTRLEVTSTYGTSVVKLKPCAGRVPVV